MKRFNRRILYFSVFCMMIGGSFYIYESQPSYFSTFSLKPLHLDSLGVIEQWEHELSGGKYYSLVDEAGQEIDQIGRVVYEGDEMILDDNRHYRVIAVDDNRYQATCQLLGKMELLYQEEWQEEMPVIQTAVAGKKKVAIYMTHTDESYVPTEGKESIKGRGGILEVGKTLAERFKKQGVETEISLNKHDPHDANAYHRSRRTAVQLLKGNPSAIIDVHRDGVPDPNFYKATIKGQDATKIRLVVGRQNPHMTANLDFAKQIKAYFDKTQPGLVKGIYMAKGNYNQDLSPRAMLIEVGTHTNPRQAAEAGVSFFGDGIAKMLGAAGPVAPQSPGTDAVNPRTGTGNALFWLLGVVILGGGAFLLISTGSFEASWKKLSSLGKEFSNYLGPIRRKK